MTFDPIDSICTNAFYHENSTKAYRKVFAIKYRIELIVIFVRHRMSWNQDVEIELFVHRIEHQALARGENC